MEESIRIHECDALTAKWLEEKLLASLQSINVQATNSNIMMAATLPDGRIVGGLVASTSYGWLLVKILWVDNEYRGSGVGRSLMAQAEALAREYQCHGAWLDTSSKSAHGFYLALGYETFGKLSNTDEQILPEHHRWFMKKAL